MVLQYFVNSSICLISSVIYIMLRYVQHFARVAKSRNISLEVVAELKFALDKTYNFQRSQSKDISVSLLRFSHVQCGLTATVGNLPAVSSVKTKQPKSKTASRR